MDNGGGGQQPPTNPGPDPADTPPVPEPNGLANDTEYNSCTDFWGKELNDVNFYLSTEERHIMAQHRLCIGIRIPARSKTMRLNISQRVTGQSYRTVLSNHADMNTGHALDSKENVAAGQAASHNFTAGGEEIVYFFIEEKSG